MKKRRLLFKQVIKCPNSHETVSKVYEDNGYLYYECGICGMIVGLDSPQHKEKVAKKVLIGTKFYPRNNESGGFSGKNCYEITSIFRKRKQTKENEKRK